MIQIGDFLSTPLIEMSHQATYIAGLSDGSTMGFWSGGEHGTKTASTDMLAFATQVTAAKTTADLSLARSRLTGVGDMGF